MGRVVDDEDDDEDEEREEGGAIPVRLRFARSQGEGGDVGNGGEGRVFEGYWAHVRKASRECAAVSHG